MNIYTDEQSIIFGPRRCRAGHLMAFCHPGRRIDVSLGCGWAAIMTPRRVTFIKPLIVVIVNTAADLDGVLFSVFVFS